MTISAMSAFWAQTMLSLRMALFLNANHLNRISTFACLPTKLIFTFLEIQLKVTIVFHLFLNFFFLFTLNHFFLYFLGFSLNQLSCYSLAWYELPIVSPICIIIPIFLNLILISIIKLNFFLYITMSIILFKMILLNILIQLIPSLFHRCRSLKSIVFVLEMFLLLNWLFTL